MKAFWLSCLGEQSGLVKFCVIDKCAAGKCLRHDEFIAGGWVALWVQQSPKSYFGVRPSIMMWPPLKLSFISINPGYRVSNAIQVVELKNTTSANRRFLGIGEGGFFMGTLELVFSKRAWTESNMFRRLFLRKVCPPSGSTNFARKTNADQFRRNARD